jgi:hypothetical protein
MGLFNNETVNDKVSNPVNTAIMKKIFSLLIIVTVHQTVFSQSPRQCGCKTWRVWKSELPASNNDSRSNKKKQYAEYLEGCLKTCREKAGKKTESLSLK